MPGEACSLSKLLGENPRRQMQLHQICTCQAWGSLLPLTPTCPGSGTGNTQSCSCKPLILTFMGLGRGCAAASQVCPLFLGPLVLGRCGGTLSSTFLWLWCEKSCAGVEPFGGPVQGDGCHSCSFTPLGSPCSLQLLVQSGPCRGSAPGLPCALGGQDHPQG